MPGDPGSPACKRAREPTLPHGTWWPWQLEKLGQEIKKTVRSIDHQLIPFHLWVNGHVIHPKRTSPHIQSSQIFSNRKTYTPTAHPHTTALTPKKKGSNGPRANIDNGRSPQNLTSRRPGVRGTPRPTAPRALGLTAAVGNRRGARRETDRRGVQPPGTRAAVACSWRSRRGQSPRRPRTCRTSPRRRRVRGCGERRTRLHRDFNPKP